MGECEVGSMPESHVKENTRHKSQNMETKLICCTKDTLKSSYVTEETKTQKKKGLGLWSTSSQTAPLVTFSESGESRERENLAPVNKEKLLQNEP